MNHIKQHFKSHLPTNKLYDSHEMYNLSFEIQNLIDIISTNIRVDNKFEVTFPKKKKKKFRSTHIIIIVQ